MDYSTLDDRTAFVAVRAVRNADHNLGTVAVGQTVLFRRNGPISGGDGWYMCYTNGEPTDGNQFCEFEDLAGVRAFIDRTGLRALPPEGAKVRFIRAVERYPHFIIDVGVTGTVHYGDDDFSDPAVKADEHIDGCEEWDNDVMWPECVEQFPFDVEVIDG